MRLSRLSSIVGVALVLLAGSANVARAQQAQGNLQFTTIVPTGLQVVGNVVTATGGTVTGTLAGLPFTTNITNFRMVLDDPATLLVVECPVLDLALGPIDIDLLGLHVDTSAICLKITAIPGGGLLGDLLCGLNLNPLGGLGGFLDQLIDELNDALSQHQPGPGGGGNDDICDGPCEILDLALGPLDLNLLGLRVQLDDCDEGPVLICVSASRTGLLGNLLCGLTNAQISNLTLAEIAILGQRAAQLAADGSLSPRDVAQLTALLVQLIRS